MSGPVRLSVVIPAKDEASRIADSVAQVRAALRDLGEGASEVIVVDDGSIDGTAAAAASAGASVVALPVNRGKGAAVRAGVASAQGSVVAYTDADLSYAPEDHLLRLLAAVEGGCPIAVGSRRHPESEALVHASVVRRVAGRVFNGAVALLVLGEVRDTQCGVKAFSKEAAEVVFPAGRLEGFAFDVELFAVAKARGLAVCEVPVRLVADEVSTVKVAPAAARMLADLVRIRRLARQGTYGLGMDAEGERRGR